MDLGAELRAILYKLYEITTYTDLSGEEHMRIEDAIKEALRAHGEKTSI